MRQPLVGSALAAMWISSPTSPGAATGLMPTRCAGCSPWQRARPGWNAGFRRFPRSGRASAAFLGCVHESRKSEITDHPVRTGEPLNALCFLTRLIASRRSPPSALILGCLSPCLRASVPPCIKKKTYETPGAWFFLSAFSPFKPIGKRLRFLNLHTPPAAFLRLFHTEARRHGGTEFF